MTKFRKKGTENGLKQVQNNFFGHRGEIQNRERKEDSTTRNGKLSHITLFSEELYDKIEKDKTQVSFI